MGNVEEHVTQWKNILQITYGLQALLNTMFINKSLIWLSTQNNHEKYFFYITDVLY